MSIAGPFVHHLDPIIGTFFGVHLWWYGLSYTLGLLVTHMYLSHRREQLGLSAREVQSLSLALAAGVLLGGRFVEVIAYEWPFYRAHVALIPAYWLGGMATHGVLLGGLIAVWLFCRIHRQRLLRVTDELALPAAVMMALGRIGNFIDGQIVGSVTAVSWAVKFPDAEGFRHPVVLYDGLKNLCIAPILMYAGGRHLRPGVRTGLFLFLYAALRIFVDVFREYPTSLLGFATGQVLNVVTALVGLGLMIALQLKGRVRGEAAVTLPMRSRHDPPRTIPGWRALAFAVLLLFALVIPSDWTQDIPVRYASRHSGLHHSAIYPPIAAWLK